MPVRESQTVSTLEEVGAKAGCSQATVSRVLNNSGPVSVDVRRNVLRVLQEAGYVPRRTRRITARTDSARPDFTKGLVEVILHRCTPMERLSSDATGIHIEPSVKVDGKALLSNSYRLSADFYMHIISGVMDELAAAGRRGALQTTDNLTNPKLLAEVNRPDSRGVLLLGEYSPDPVALGQFISRCSCPLVLIDMIHAGRPDVVTMDNMGGISLAMEHLLSLGHRDIGFVGAPSNPSFEERWTSFQWKMAGAGLTVRPEWVCRELPTVEDTARGVSRILRGDRLPTAFVCVNDWHAMGVLRAAEACGVSVPGQLSVVGFDDVNAAAMVTPPLTTLHVPLRQIGQQAVRQMLVGELFDQSQRQQGCIVRLMPQLVVRQSTAVRYCAA